jgi:hypothetical protein
MDDRWFRSVVVTSSVNVELAEAMG